MKGGHPSYTNENQANYTENSDLKLSETAHNSIEEMVFADAPNPLKNSSKVEDNQKTFLNSFLT